MRRSLLLAAAVFVVVFGLAVAGCGGDEKASSPEASGPSSVSAVPFDRAFIDGMVPHHEGAIEMAKAAKAAGLSQPELIKIADDIIATQQTEIDQMKDWRAEWFGSPEIDPLGADALGLSEEMMGMQHDASALDGAGDVDAMFAQMMIDHHNGAIEMARLAKNKGQHAEIRELADAIIAAQEREVAIMEKHAAGDHDGH